MAKIKSTHGLNKGDLVRYTAASMANGGDAVGRVEGVPVFVERAAPGDELEVRLYDVRKDFAHGSIETMIKPSPHRAKPPCFHYERCGGCQWQHIDYADQLVFKRNLVVESLQHIAGLDEPESDRTKVQDLVATTIGCADPFHYRNKMQFPTSHKMGQVLAGYYERGSHDLVNIDSCPIQPELIDELLQAVRVLLKEYKVPIYSEERHNGLVRHINMRISHETKRVLVTFVVNHDPVKYKKFAQIPELYRISGLAAELMDNFGEVAGVVINFNPARGNRILGNDTLTVLGADHIIETLRTSREDLPAKLREGLAFRLSSNSFFQVNTPQAVRLLEEVAKDAREALGEKQGQALIVDAYAGVGTIALWLSPFARQVIAIEEVQAAVQDGQMNVQLNEIENIEFVQGKVEDTLEKILEESGEMDLLVLDPPRKGAAPSVIECLRRSGPHHIIYVSCNPASLARDIKLLGQPIEGAKYGYKAIRIQPIDLFPQTYHVESVALLERYTIQQ